MTLYLIGNGFDLYHGLPSSYYYFACYLIDNNYSLYEEMANMYGFKCKKMINPISEDFEPIIDDFFWCTFEEKLGNLDHTWLEFSLMDDLGLEYPEDPVDLEIPESQMSKKIINSFSDWIRKTLNTQNNYELIKKHIKNSKNCLCLNPNDYYINFNYTQTLEQIYNIPSQNICHLHGFCSLNPKESKNHQIIVGHGNKSHITSLEKTIKEYRESDEYLTEQAVRNRTHENEALKKVLVETKKDVDNLKITLIDYLDENNIVPSDIKVMGLSCGEIDKPYIKELVNKFPQAKWHFSFYDEKEQKNREMLAEELGIQKPNFFEFVNSSSDLIKKAIVEQYNIVEFNKYTS